MMDRKVWTPKPGVAADELDGRHLLGVGRVGVVGRPCGGWRSEHVVELADALADPVVVALDEIAEQR